MKKRQLLFFYLLLTAFAATAQSTAGIDTQNNNAEDSLNQNPRQSLEAATKARAEAETIKYKKGQARAMAIMGVANFKIDNYDQAKTLLAQADTINRQIADTSDWAFCKYWLGNIELIRSNYSNAFDLFQNANALAEKINDKRNLARSFDGEASIYEAIGEDEKALTLYKASFNTAREAEFKAWYPTVLLSLGNLAYKKGKVDTAIQIYNNAIAKSDEVNNINNKANCYQKLAEIYYNKKDSKKAMEYITQAMALFQQTGSTTSLSYSRLLMSYIVLSDKAYTVAIDLGQLSLQEGKANNEIQLQRDAAQVLYYAYLGLGDKSKALEYHVLFHDLTEADNNDELARRLARLDLEANFKKERQLAKAVEAKKDAELDKQRVIKNFSILAVFMFAIISGLAIFAFYQKRKDSRIIASEKSRSDNLLLNILPPEIVAEIKKTDYKDNSVSTIFFADMKVVLGRTEDNGARNMQAAFDYYYREFDKIISQYKIEKIKTVGDAYMCISSASTTGEEAAVNVVAAALKIREFVEHEREARVAKGQIYFEVSIGINTGPVIAGIIGIRKFSYDVWGDAVNVAARMEQHGEEGKINIAGSTYRLVKDKFKCTYRGEVETKKNDRADMYFVDSALG